MAGTVTGDHQPRRPPGAGGACALSALLPGAVSLARAAPAHRGRGTETIRRVRSAQQCLAAAVAVMEAVPPAVAAASFAALSLTPVPCSASLLPPLQLDEEGKEINPHIPSVSRCPAAARFVPLLRPLPPLSLLPLPPPPAQPPPSALCPAPPAPRPAVHGRRPLVPELQPALPEASKELEGCGDR